MTVPDHSTAIRLTVGDARLGDIGEAIVRLSSKAIRTLALERGDRVRISGDRSSLLVRALPSGPEDDGLDLIRMDAAQRRQLAAQLGDSVEVRRYVARLAERIQLIAIGNIRRADISPADIRDALGSGQVMAGDSFTITPDGRVFEAHLSVLGIQLASVAGSSSDARGLVVRVQSTEPDGPVEVAPTTDIELLQAGTEGT
jgi:hypothetical protein